MIAFIPKRSRFRLQRLSVDRVIRYIIIDPSKGVFAEGQSYIREMYKWRSSNPKTVRGVAYVIIDWCNFLREKRLTWYQASADDYNEWMEAQDLSKRRLARKNRIIWSWYRHLYTNLMYQALATSTFEGISLPTSEQAFGKPRYVPQHGSGQKPNAKKARKSKTFITDETVDTLRERLADLGNEFRFARDSLIVEFESRCGLRAIGISDIVVSQMNLAFAQTRIIAPHESILSFARDRAGQAKIRNRLDKLEEIGSSGVIINVTEKFSKSRDVMLETGLLHQTLDFLWSYHERWRVAGSRAYRSDAKLFLSLKTGEGLLPGTVSDIVRKYFKRFGLDGSGHDLRRYKVTSKALDLVRKSKKQSKLFDGTAIEMALADEFGHDKFSTMGPYVNVGRIMDAIGEEVEDHYKR